MGEIINLNRARKGKAKVQARSAAAENRAKFGRTNAEKAAAESERDAIARTIDGARRDLE
jgi:hypothetical protein